MWLLIICIISGIILKVDGVEATTCHNPTLNAAEVRTTCEWTDDNLANANAKFKANAGDGVARPDWDKAKEYCNGFHRRLDTYTWQANNYMIRCSPQSQTRTRKSWWEIDNDEKDKFVRAFYVAASTGNPSVAQEFAYSHGVGRGGGFNDYHSNPEFYPYHRGLLYRFEQWVRKQPAPVGQPADYFADFAVPYLDMTVVQGNGGGGRGLNGGNGQDWQDIIRNGPNRGLGGREDVGMNGRCGCLTSGKFASNPNPQNPGNWRYRPNAKRGNRNCLRRCTNTAYPWKDVWGVLQEIGLHSNDFDNNRCRAAACGTHSAPHNEIGGASGGTMRDGKWSPEDPIFYLHHAWVDYTWALWQTCHGHQTYQNLPGNHYKWTGGPGNDMTRNIVYGGVPNPFYDVDPLRTQGPQNSPVVQHEEYDNNREVRDLLLLHGGHVSLADNPKRGNGFWDTVVYAKSNFWTRASLDNGLHGLCGPDTNGWFVNGRRRRMAEGEDEEEYNDQHYINNTYFTNKNHHYMDLDHSKHEHLLNYNATMTRRRLPINGPIKPQKKKIKLDPKGDKDKLVGTSTSTQQLQKKSPQKGPQNKLQNKKNEQLKLVVVPEQKAKYPDCLPKPDVVFKNKEDVYKSNMKLYIDDMARESCICRLGDAKCDDKQTVDCAATFEWDDTKKDIVIDDVEKLLAITPPCHKATRKDLFEWATEWNVLYSLCLGCFDMRCNEDEIEDICNKAINREKPVKPSTAHVNDYYDTVKDDNVNDYYGDHYYNKHHEEVTVHEHVTDHKYYPNQYLPNQYHPNNDNHLILCISILFSMVIICCICLGITCCVGGISGSIGAAVAFKAYTYFDKTKTEEMMIDGFEQEV